MRSNPISPIVLAAALSACTLESEVLNSERIEQRFGSYGIDVIEHEAGVRRSTLYSIEGNRRVCRTYAVVQFLEQGAAEVADVHQSVLAGDSIGATFKATGWQIYKETLHVGNLVLDDPRHPISELMHLDKQAQLALHVYRLILEKEARSVHYATIIEAHHPDYLAESELAELYEWDGSTIIGAENIADIVELVLDKD